MRVKVQASRCLSLPPRQALTVSTKPLHILTSHEHRKHDPPQLPTKSHIHMPSFSLTDLQIDLVVKKVFILVADHDRNLSVVHNLLEVKEPCRPHAGPEEPTATALVLSGRSTLE